MLDGYYYQLLRLIVTEGRLLLAVELVGLHNKGLH